MWRLIVHFHHMLPSAASSVERCRAQLTRPNFLLMNFLVECEQSPLLEFHATFTFENFSAKMCEWMFSQIWSTVECHFTLVARIENASISLLVNEFDVFRHLLLISEVFPTLAASEWFFAVFFAVHLIHVQLQALHLHQFETNFTSHVKLHRVVNVHFVLRQNRFLSELLATRCAGKSFLSRMMAIMMSLKGFLLLEHFRAHVALKRLALVMHEMIFHSYFAEYLTTEGARRRVFAVHDCSYDTMTVNFHRVLLEIQLRCERFRAFKTFVAFRGSMVTNVREHFRLVDRLKATQVTGVVRWILWWNNFRFSFLHFLSFWLWFHSIFSLS